MDRADASRLYRDPAEAPIRCKTKGYQVPLLLCLKCRKFPCVDISDAHMETLETSEFVDREYPGWEVRRTRMYIFRKNDGSLVEAPRDFDPDKPDFTTLEDVSEVLVISKVLVKQVRLVPKSKEEITRVRAEKNNEAQRKRK